MYRRRNRSYRRKRKTFRRRGYKKWASKVYKAVASKAEKKWADFIITASVSTGGVITEVTQGIINGTGQENRIGHVIHLRYLRNRFILTSNGEDLLFVRIALLRGRAAALGLSDVPTGANAIREQFDIDKWDVLWDHTYNLGDADTDGRNKAMMIKTTKIMRKVVWDRNQTTGTFPAVVNPIYFYSWSSDVVTTGTNVDGVVRMYFTDI